VKDQYGSAGRDQYNVGRDLHIHDTGDGSSHTNSTRGINGKKREATAGGFGILVTIVIIVLITNPFSSAHSLPNSPFPSKGNHWPAGITFESIMAPVLHGLQTCSHAPVLKPANCPQAQADDYSSDVSNVHWSLHGNPTDGAKVVYWHNRFIVGGNAIMKVAFKDDNGHNLDIDIVHFRANVRWQNGQAQLVTLTGVSSTSGPRVVKHPPAVTWNQIETAVRDAFNACVRERTMPLSPPCPTGQSFYETGGDARWHLTGDPLLNSHQSFDPASGIINVTGSYAMSVTYPTLFGKQRASQSGNYNAAVSLDGSRISVLQIKSD
jgi:hypothetical protein